MCIINLSEQMLQSIITPSFGIKAIHSHSFSMLAFMYPRLYNKNQDGLCIEFITMIIIRNYDETTDTQAVGVLIAETYRKFNLDFASPEDQRKLLGPFLHAGSSDPVHQESITRVLRAEMIFVADDGGQIVGVLRCRPGRLQSLFVREDHHRQSIGKMLVERCEQECARRGSKNISLAATLYAVPFYEAVGYKKSTGVRNGWSFDGRGLRYQPMKKVLTGQE
jgi:GNAT superfamily N-acetyltransferase